MTLWSLWSQVNALLKPPPTVVTESSSADEFANHFTAKVNGIRAATAIERTSCRRRIYRTTSSLSAFQAVITEEIIALLKKVPPKHCDLDSVPTKKYVDANQSLRGC